MEVVKCQSEYQPTLATFLAIWKNIWQLCKMLGDGKIFGNYGDKMPLFENVKIEAPIGKELSRMGWIVLQEFLAKKDINAGRIRRRVFRFFVL